jgi:hypothetical protein
MLVLLLICSSPKRNVLIGQRAVVPPVGKLHVCCAWFWIPCMSWPKAEYRKIPMTFTNGSCPFIWYLLEIWQ